MKDLPDAELDRLLSGAADDMLSDDENARLAERLRREPEARRHYLRYMEVNACLQWDYAEAAAEPATSIRERSSTGILVAIAAALALLAGVVSVFFQQEKTLATVAFADSAEFRTSGSEVATLLVAGDEITAGRLAVDSSSGTAALRFDDGTEITVSGGTDLHFSHTDGGLLFHLSKGHLSASVAPQPVDRPLRVRTAMAEATVLGTTLSVSVEERISRLSVEEGEVLWRRIADGDEILVHGGERAEAGLRTSERLSAFPSSPVPDSWTLEFAPDNELVTNGSHATVAGIPCLVAEPYVAGRDNDGTTEIRTGVSINGRIVRLGPDSVVRVRYRSEWGPLVFLGTATEDGRFGGNFETRLISTQHPPGPDGWREVEIPITDFELVGALRGRDYSPESCTVKKIIISVHDEHRLQIGALSISPK